MHPKRRHRIPPPTLDEPPPDRREFAQARVGSARPATATETDWSMLMVRAQAGDGEAYRQLLEQIAPYVRALAIRLAGDPVDAEDAVQDVLLTVHAIRHTYDPSRPFGPWVLAIAHRRIVDRLRRRGRARSREIAIEPKHETFPAPQANIDEARSDGRALRAAVESLPPAQRRAVKLLKLQEMSLKEAAAATGMSIASLKVTTHRAIKSLRRILVRGSEGT